MSDPLAEKTMKSILIADTTREEREQTVAESIGNIDGRKELREINMEFNVRYTRGSAGPDRCGCRRSEERI